MRIIHEDDRAPGPGRVRIAGRVEEGTGLPWERLRTLPEYALCLIIAGEGRYRDAAGNQDALGAGSLIQIVPGVGHTFNATRPWSELFLCFDGAMFRALDQPGGIIDRARPVRRVAHPDVWRRRLEAVVEQHPDWPVERPVARAGALIAILAELDAETRAPVDGHDERWLEQAKRMLGLDGLRTSAVAEALDMSTATLRRRFGKATGMSPDAWRTAQRLRRAREMIEQTDLPLERIAAMTGYANAFHLSLAFSRAMGCSPSRWRCRR